MKLIGSMRALWLAAALGAAAPAAWAHEAQEAGAQAGHHHHAAAALALGTAVSPAGDLWIAGLESGRLFVRSSPDFGRSWREPVWPATGGDAIAAEGDAAPSLAFGPKGEIVLAYTRPLAKPYTGEIRLIRSTDGGRSWSAPATVHADRQVITHRFQAMRFDGAGRLHVVWIDKRDAERAWAAARTAASGAQDAAREAERSAYRGAAIYRAVSTDGGASFGGDLELAGHSCECCRIALADAPDGRVAAVWRHVFAPDERDHAFAILDGGVVADPVRATFDHWAIDACPHHGPGLAPALGGGWHLVWFGIRNGEAAVRYGRLDATGHPAGEVRALPDARAEHADVAAIGQQVAVVWRSYDGHQTRLRAWLSADGGEHFRVAELGATEGDSDQPHLVLGGDRIYAVWRTAKGVNVNAIEP